MNSLPQHTFQLLTKRADILAKHSLDLEWTDNIWMGVSVENQKAVNRIGFLKETNAFIKFLSIEPLIGPVKNIKLEGIDWVIVGGESGPKAREIKPEWVINIKDQCEEFDVPFFFKQWGGKNKKKTGRTLNGKIYDEMPKKSTRI
jgi:protein gp37